MTIVKLIVHDVNQVTFEKRIKEIQKLLLKYDYKTSSAIMYHKYIRAAVTVNYVQQHFDTWLQRITKCPFNSMFLLICNIKLQ